MTRRWGAGRGNRAADRGGGGREEGPMKPDRYRETFLAETASRINFIARIAACHFEAAKFLIDLAHGLASRGDRDPPRRA